MRAIQRKPKEHQVIILRCPACGKNHSAHPEFGRYCCASCLQLAIRPLIVTPAPTPRRTR